MKNFVRSKFCKTPDECAHVIEELRLSFTTQKCQNNINKTMRYLRSLTLTLTVTNVTLTVTNANANGH